MAAANEEQFIFELAGEKIPVHEFYVEENISDNCDINVTLSSEDTISFDSAIG